jgi:hypothetical protein
VDTIIGPIPTATTTVETLTAVPTLGAKVPRTQADCSATLATPRVSRAIGSPGEGHHHGPSSGTKAAFRRPASVTGALIQAACRVYTERPRVGCSTSPLLLVLRTRRGGGRGAGIGNGDLAFSE